MICAAQRFPRPTWRNNCLQRPVGAGRYGGRRVRAADQFPEGPGLVEQRRSEIHVTNLQRCAPCQARSEVTPSRATRGCRGGCHRRPVARQESVRRTSAGRPRLRRGPARRQAEVPAAGERQMLARVLAFDVEGVRVVEHLRVAVGPGEIEDHAFAAPDHRARDVDVLGRDSRAELNRRVEPQDLLDGVRPQLGARASVSRCSACRAASEFRCPAG